jgi:hypothetical protein
MGIGFVDILALRDEKAFSNPRNDAFRVMKGRFVERADGR